MRAILRHAKSLTYLLIVALLSLSLPQQPARAAMVATESVIASATEAQAAQSERDRVRAFLQREEVRAQIQAYGLSPEETIARLDSLTDREIAMIAGKLNELPAGGYVSGDALGAFLVLAVLGLVVVVMAIVWVVKKGVEAVAGSTDAESADGQPSKAN